MVLNISDFFNWKGGKSRRPLINQIPVNITTNSAVGISSTLTKKQKFWRWFKGRPELNSPVMVRVDDTIVDVSFQSRVGGPLGRNTYLQAQDFYSENQLHERLKSIQYDRLVSGSGFLWLGRHSQKQVKEVIQRCMERYWFKDINMREVGEIVVRKIIDEDLRRVRSVDYIPSSTVMIEHDQHDVKKYVQWFGAWTAEFMPEEVIHIPLIRADGKVDGFTPVESLNYEIALLWAIKENMWAYMRNGGSPNKVFILPDEISNSENHKHLVNELMDRGRMQNRHGNMVLTGQVNVEQLEDNIKDMEYKELALFVTSNIAYALRVPVSRIPYMIGQSQSKGDASGMAENGYWNMIESDQKTLETALNQQLFRKLGFYIKFKKRYKIDDLREAQSKDMLMDAIGKARTELFNCGLKLKKQKILDMISGTDFELTESDVEEVTDKDRMIESGMMNKSRQPDGQVSKEPGQINKDSTKRGAAKNNPSSSNQTGY